MTRREADKEFNELKDNYFQALDDYQSDKIGSEEFLKVGNSLFSKFGIVTEEDACYSCARHLNCPVLDFRSDEEPDRIIGCRMFIRN